MESLKVLVVGGSVAGVSVAARLRSLDESVAIVLMEKSGHCAVARSGLSCRMGDAEGGREASVLPGVGRNVDVRLYTEVLSIDRKTKSVVARDRGTSKEYVESYDKLILAPSVRPARPQVPGIASPRVFSLCSKPDSGRIRNYLSTFHPRTVIIVGDGCIGEETASILYQAGVSVTLVVDPSRIPDEAVSFSPVPFGRRIAGGALRSVVEDAEGLTVVFEETRLQADMLLLASGGRIENSLAREAGLPVSDSGAILVDARMRTADHDVYAVGDAAVTPDFADGCAITDLRDGFVARQADIVAEDLQGCLGPSVMTRMK
ncbi:MAG: NAD(P)/FAD-dependent oxidoreductase [Sphaerochaetaceae bacterium]